MTHMADLLVEVDMTDLLAEIGMTGLLVEIGMNETMKIGNTASTGGSVKLINARIGTTITPISLPPGHLTGQVLEGQIGLRTDIIPFIAVTLDHGDGHGSKTGTETTGHPITMTQGSMKYP